MGRQINRLNRTYRLAKAFKNSYNINSLMQRIASRTTRVEDQEYTVYQRVMEMVKRNNSHDKTIPIQTVYLNQDNTTSNKVSETANIHIGPYANDLALSMNAIAFALGNDIYFRSGKYQPESEEGRKIIAHELKHVEQHQEKRIDQNADIKELEKEAEIAEQSVEYDPDPYKYYIINNKRFRFRDSQIKRVIEKAADGVVEWIRDQKYVRSEEDYLKLLLTYRDWLNEGVPG